MAIHIRSGSIPERVPPSQRLPERPSCAEPSNAPAHLELTAAAEVLRCERSFSHSVVLSAMLYSERTIVTRVC